MWRPADTPEVQLFVPLKNDRKPEDDPFASENGVNFQGQTIKLPGSKQIKWLLFYYCLVDI